MTPTDGGNATSAQLAEIPQRGNSLGDPRAPVSLDYFGDLQCPYCRDFSLEVLPPIIQRWVQTGRLRVQYRALETATRDPDVFVAQQVAALAAGRQNKAWNFIETFYAEQGEEGSGYVTDAYLEGIASQIPQLDLSRWAADRTDPELIKELDEDAEAAENAGLSGTPTFLLGPTGGAMKPFSPTGETSFDAAIAALAGS
jgi:protein-disulfide isomerase